MIRYEYKKVLTNRFLIIFTLIFLFLDIYMIHNEEMTAVYEKKSDYYGLKENVYENIRGQITEDKLKYLSEEGALENDYPGIYLSYGDNIRNALNYKEKAEKVVKKAKTNVEMYQDFGFEALLYKNKIIADSFSGRSINQYYDFEGVDNYLTYDYSTAMVLILAFITAVIMFTGDKKIGMDRMVLTAVNGEKKLLIRKLTVISTVSAGIMAVFRVAEFGYYYYLYKFDGLFMPLYNVNDYGSTVFNGSIRQFIIIDITGKCVGVILLVLFISMILYFIRNNIAAYSIIAAVLTASVIISMEASNIYSPIALFNAYSMAKTVDFIRLGGIYLTKSVYVLGISLSLIFVMISAMIFIRKRR